MRNVDDNLLKLRLFEFEALPKGPQIVSILETLAIKLGNIMDLDTDIRHLLLLRGLKGCLR